MAGAPFKPTHALVHRNERGAEEAVVVMLVPKAPGSASGAGPAYTREEWDAGTRADWEKQENGDWTFQGQLPRGSLRVNPLPERLWQAKAPAAPPKAQRKAKAPKPDPVVGARIVKIRPMTAAEAEREGWEFNARHGAPTAIELDSGAVLYPSRDDEGNGPGALFGFVNGKTIGFHPREE